MVDFGSNMIDEQNVISDSAITKKNSVDEIVNMIYVVKVIEILY